MDKSSVPVWWLGTKDASEAAGVIGINHLTLLALNSSQQEKGEDGSAGAPLVLPPRTEVGRARKYPNGRMRSFTRQP